eukprot:4337831-Prymnesium_polylepis.1
MALTPSGCRALSGEVEAGGGAVRTPSRVVEPWYDNVVGVEHPDVLVRAVVGDGGHETVVEGDMIVGRWCIQAPPVHVHEDGATAGEPARHRVSRRIGGAMPRAALPGVVGGAA